MRKYLTTIGNKEIEAKRKVLGELFLEYGLTPEVVKESQELDKCIAEEQRRRLEAC